MNIKIIAAHAIGTGSHINIVITQAQVCETAGVAEATTVVLDGD